MDKEIFELWTINPEIRTDDFDKPVLYFFFKLFDGFEMFFYAYGVRNNLNIGEINKWETIVNPSLEILTNLMNTHILYASGDDMKYYWDKRTNYTFEGKNYDYCHRVSNPGAYRERVSSALVNWKKQKYSTDHTIPHAGDEDV